APWVAWIFAGGGPLKEQVGSSAQVLFIELSVLHLRLVAAARLVIRVGRLEKSSGLLFTVHVYACVSNLDPISWDSNDSLDEVEFFNDRVLEHDHIPTPCFCSLPHLNNEDMIARNQRRHHRARWDFKGFHKVGAYRAPWNVDRNRSTHKEPDVHE